MVRILKPKSFSFAPGEKRKSCLARPSVESLFREMSSNCGGLTSEVLLQVLIVSPDSFVTGTYGRNLKGFGRLSQSRSQMAHVDFSKMKV